MSNRPLIDAKTPMIGPIDTTQTPFYLVCQQGQAIYILVRCTYQEGSTFFPDGGTEYVFTSCYTGTSSSSDYREQFFVGMQVVSGAYTNYKILGGVDGLDTGSTHSVFYFVDSGAVQPALLTFDGTTLSDSLGGDLMTSSAQSSVDSQFYRFTINVPEGTGSTYGMTVLSNNLFAWPNTQAGVPYAITYNGFNPFRFVNIFDQGVDNFLLTPSVCTSDLVPPKLYNYECNNYAVASSYNLGRFIDYKYDIHGVVPIAVMTTNAQNQPFIMNIFPGVYYLSNATFGGSQLVQGSGLCSQSIDFLDEVFYFWYSDFTSFKNDPSQNSQPIVSQGTPGFIFPGTSSSVNITSWTDKADCQREYYYTYCVTPQGCGQCYGSCLSGVECNDNPNYLPPNPPVGTNPFICGTNPIPNKNTWVQFWEEYKWWIISGAVLLFLIVIAFIIVMLVINKNRRTENEQTEIVYSESGKVPKQKPTYLAPPQKIPKSEYYTPSSIVS